MNHHALSIALAVFLASIAGCVSTEKYDLLSATNDGLQAQLAESQSRASSLSQALEDTTKKLDATQAELEKTEAQLQQAQQARDELSKALKSNRNELQNKIASLSKDKQELQDKIAGLETDKRKLEAEAERRLKETQDTYDAMLDNLKSEVEQGEVQISQLRGKLQVNVAERLFFDSGSAEIKRGGKEVLQKVSEVLQQVPEKDVRVEGHTDNVPIGKALQAKYPSNWNLAAARAINVVRFLEEETKLATERLHAVSYGPYQPLVPNDSEENRRKNRRITIVLVDPVISAPTQTTAPASPTAPTD